MSIQNFYRLTLWLPLVVPVLVKLAGPGMLPPGLEQLLLGSLLYGGLPYAAVALAATFWIDHRPEGVIRHHALRSPLWMVAAWVPFTILIGVRSGRVGMAVAVFVIGLVPILALGSLYVMLVFALRAIFYGRFGPTP